MCFVSEILGQSPRMTGEAFVFEILGLSAKNDEGGGDKFIQKKSYLCRNDK